MTSHDKKRYFVKTLDFLYRKFGMIFHIDNRYRTGQEDGVLEMGWLDSYNGWANGCATWFLGDMC